MEITEESKNWIKARLDIGEPIKYIGFKKIMVNIGKFEEQYNTKEYEELMKLCFNREKLTRRIERFKTQNKPIENKETILTENKPVENKPVENKENAPVKEDSSFYNSF
jgi:hypothetical protein